MTLTLVNFYRIRPWIYT